MNKTRIAEIDSPKHCPYRVEYFKCLDNFTEYGDDTIALCCNPNYLRTVGTYPKCDSLRNELDEIVGFPSCCPLTIKKPESTIGIVPGRC